MIRKILFIFILGFLFRTSQATHIVGGDFTCKWISGNSFEITVTLFRDRLGTAPFDATITVGLFDKVTNATIGSFDIDLTDTSDLLAAGTNCSPPPEINIHQGRYIETITIPDNTNGYYLAWERCCRNHSVLNILNPGATGMTFYIEIPDPALHNSSPVFLNDPLPYMCEEQPFKYNFGGYDADGDSLVYALVTPIAGNSSTTNPTLPNVLPAPYPPIAWAPGYSVADVCGGTVPLTVSPATGEINCTPALFGIYAMAEECREFRNGIQIGLIRREIEFTVIICDGNFVPDAVNVNPSGNGNPNNYVIYETDTVCFTLKASDANGDSIFISHTGDCFAGTGINPPYATATDTFGLGILPVDFCWYTGCGQSRPDPYHVKYIILDNGCPFALADTHKVTITIKPLPLYNVDLMCMQLKSNSTVTLFINDTLNNGPARYFNYYVVYRNKNGSGFLPIDTLKNITVTSYADATAFNNDIDNYCYTIQSFNTCGQGTFSDTLCTADAYNTKKNYIRTVSVQDKNIIHLKWEHFNEQEQPTVHILRTERDSLANINSFKPVAVLAKPGTDEWTDYSVLTSDKSYCYVVINEDYCGNRSPVSEPECTILLTGNSGRFESNLAWTKYENWNGGVLKYEVYKRDVYELFFAKEASMVAADNFYTDKNLDNRSGLFYYKIKAFEGAGSYDEESRSNEIVLMQPPLFFVPNAFTPNADFANDGWGIEPAFVKEYEVTVYDRLGYITFHSTNPNEKWNGKNHGKDSPQGVYVYRMKVKGYDNDDEYEKIGTVTLIR